MSDTRELCQRLAAPFDPDVIDWKPQTVKGDRALAVAYIDARAVGSRLDEVLGVFGWETRFEDHPSGSVICHLTVHDAESGRSVTKSDVGTPSDQPDKGDKLKAAYSDALKRAAVHFGVGRYLYQLPSQWCDYDSQKKRFTRTPSLPAWAMPAKNGHSRPQEAAQEPPKQKPTSEPDITTAAFVDALRKMDAYLWDHRYVSEPGHLNAAVKERAKAKGWEEHPAKWPEGARRVALKWAQGTVAQIEAGFSDAYRSAVKWIVEAGDPGELEAVKGTIQANGKKPYQDGEWQRIQDLIEAREEILNEAAGRAVDNTEEVPA